MYLKWCRILLVAASLSCLYSCAVELPQQGTGVYLGIVFVKAEESSNTAFQKTHINAAGLWVDSNESIKGGSAGLGWKASEVIVAEKDCRLVIFIDEDVDLDQAMLTVNSTLGEREDLCVIN